MISAPHIYDDQHHTTHYDDSTTHHDDQHRTHIMMTSITPHIMMTSTTHHGLKEVPTIQISTLPQTLLISILQQTRLLQFQYYNKQSSNFNITTNRVFIRPCHSRRTNVSSAMMASSTGVTTSNGLEANSQTQLHQLLLFICSFLKCRQQNTKEQFDNMDIKCLR